LTYRVAHGLRVWLVDPISYSGMAYSDVGQILALQELGARPTLVGSDSWMLPPDVVPRMAIFRGTHGGQSRHRRGARYVASLVRLLRRSRSLRPDIIHWQFTELPVGDVIAMFVIRLLGIPQAYTAHELLPWDASPHHRWVFARLYGLVDAIFVHNEQQKAALIRRFHVDPPKVHVAPLGDYSRFASPELAQSEARARLGALRDVPVALFFGSIRPSKGLEVLLEAWASVVRQVPDAILLVTGKPYKGLQVADTIASINRLGIEASVVTRFEQVDPEETNLYYRAADVVVLPYHAIGTSGVLRYAYNSARPVVATSVGEHTAQVISGETGYLVPPGDPEVLADTLARLLGNRSLLASLGRNAQIHASTQLGWIEPAREMLRVYEDVCRAR
jgi:glycosyltransferase involved in cell wall biosynthesis